MHREASTSPKTLLILVVLVVLAGCGGDTSSSTRPNSTERERSSTTSPSALSTTTSVGQTDDSTAVVSGGIGDIGVLGCSNTAQHVDGYLALSDVDRLISTPLGGGDFLSWGDPTDQGYDGYWAGLSASVAAGEVVAIWAQLCVRGKNQTEMTSGDQAAVAHIVDRLREQYGDVTIYMSGINLYEEGYVCRKTGENGVAISWELADWAVAELEVVKGPVTGPLGPGTVDSDGCHLSPAGEELVGAQLVDWFDGA